MICVKNLSYSYENNQGGLQNVNFEIQRGERIGIVGANGSGKSTLFKCLSGILKANAGEIHYQGNPLSTKFLRQIFGFVFQEAEHQIIGSTVKQEVCFGLMNQGCSKEEIRAKSNYALSYMGLLDLQNRLTYQLSGGEKKRLTIADMLAMDYEVLLFDEPTVALDEPHLTQFCKLLSNLEQDGKTLCISSHDVDFLYEWAEKLFVFGNGSILASGSPKEIFGNSSLIKNAKIGIPKLVQMYQSYFDEEEQRKLSIPSNIEDLISMIHQKKGEKKKS